MDLRKLFLCFFALLISAQEPTEPPPSADELLRLGSSARLSENFETALDAWRKGMRLFANDVRFPAALADLFYDQGLYQLAADAYERARALRPREYDYASRLAETYGLLNRDQEAIRVLEEMQVLFPDSWSVIQSLSWMLFKVEDFQRGVDLLLEATNRLGDNPSAEMTLGTLYASLYTYERSKHHYLRSIDLGAIQRGPIFLSIAWYNLSILENTFFEHDLALASIQKSLEYARRASGLIALGEMQEMRGDYELARITYKESSAIDDTPLSRMNLARLYLDCGDPETAMEHLREVERHPDPSWIFNFGLREVDWQRDLHEAWAIAWEQKSALLDWEPRFWPWEWFSWLWRKAAAFWEIWHHRESWRDLTWSSADESHEKGNTPSVLWKTYRSLQSYYWPSAKYLALSRVWDEARIPASPRFYAMRSALDAHDLAATEAAWSRLHPVWDAGLIEEAYLFLGRRGSTLADDELLWSRNPGRMLASGRVLGFRWLWQGEEPSTEWANWARQIGWATDEAEGVLTLIPDKDGLTWTAEAGGRRRSGRVNGNPRHGGFGLALLRDTHRTISP